MDILSAIPVEAHGMSVFTLIVFTFIGTGGIFVYNLFKRELKRVNDKIHTQSENFNFQIKDTNAKVDLLFQKIDNTNGDIAEIKAHIAATHEAVTWIKSYLYKGK